MKKVLFATSALVASAGIASAQGVELSGHAEMGIIGGSGIETQFHTDIDVKFTMSGETDNGLTFGATIDLDEEGGFGNTNGGPESVFISGSFGTLTMGDTDGALDWALTEVGMGGAIADDHTAHGGYNGNSRADGQQDGQIARYDYSFGDFAFAVSAEIDDAGADDPSFGIGAKYSGDMGGVTLGVGVGYQSYENGSGTHDAFGVSLSAKMDNGLSMVVNYSDMGDTDAGGVDESHWGVGIGYTMDALTFAANYGVYEEGASQQDGFGLAVNYDLGGGAVVQFGYGSTGSCGVYAGCVADSNTFSLGVAMSF